MEWKNIIGLINQYSGIISLVAIYFAYIKLSQGAIQARRPLFMAIKDFQNRLANHKIETDPRLEAAHKVRDEAKFLGLEDKFVRNQTEEMFKTVLAIDAKEKTVPPESKWYPLINYSNAGIFGRFYIRLKTWIKNTVQKW